MTDLEDLKLKFNKQLTAIESFKTAILNSPREKLLINAGNTVTYAEQELYSISDYIYYHRYADEWEIVEIVLVLC